MKKFIEINFYVNFMGLLIKLPNDHYGASWTIFSSIIWLKNIKEHTFPGSYDSQCPYNML